MTPRIVALIAAHLDPLGEVFCLVHEDGVQGQVVDTLAMRAHVAAGRG